ncbi:hypothetical protein DPMN_104055 [Dreissena polymorpha]|uniref:Uncharacterized protein n=1 Tax=Dreissena polymorpha TaxID=45954 RepID=A0A9D4H9M7_DREPO|nr:hypothetical protein DPMN_104055 [Dreissena polymorpha]
MAIEQAHQQANAIIKEDGGTVGVTEDPSALRRWMVAGPELSRLVSEFEKMFEDKEVTKSVRHQEQTMKTQSGMFLTSTGHAKRTEGNGQSISGRKQSLIVFGYKVIAAAGAIEQPSKHLPNGRERLKSL